MFTPGGQLDLLSFHGVYGGGKGGGGNQTDPYASKPIVLTDPVNGKTFVQESNPNIIMMQSRFGFDPPKTAQQQLNEEIAQRQAQEKADSDAAAAKKTSDAAAAESTFQTSRQKAYDDALQAVQRKFQLQGVDPATYMTSDIVPTLQRQFNSIQDLSPNPAAAFPDTLADSIIGNVTGGKRTQANTALNQIFTPQYVNNLLPDTTTNNFVPDILNEQFNPLSQQLTNAEKRGTLNPVGYQAALDALTQKKTAAQSTLQNLGQGILDTDRSGINDIISGARTSANSLGLADTFDPSVFAGQAGSRAQADLSNFGGALRSAVGDTKFADLTDLLNAGGAVQGAANPNAANPTGGIQGTSQFFVSPDEEAKKGRGLGNTGAF